MKRCLPVTTLLRRERCCYVLPLLLSLRVNALGVFPAAVAVWRRLIVASISNNGNLIVFTAFYAPRHHVDGLCCHGDGFLSPHDAASGGDPVVECCEATETSNLAPAVSLS